MSDVEHTQNNTEHPQNPFSQPAGTSVDEPQNSSAHQHHSPTATAPLSAPANVIDSNLNPFTVAAAEHSENTPTPALPPRPEATADTMATAHVADELPPPTTNVSNAHPQQEQQQHPSVAQLKAMFPDFDDGLLESVLASVDYNEDAAVDILLGMSDPSYVSSQQHHPAPQPSSVDLDEALARQLQLEDERQATGGHVPPRASGQSWPRRSADGRDVEVPYAARAGQPHPASAQGQGPDFNEIRETFNQIAESGKRTFSSIFSKVKAKINELDTGRPQQQYDQHPPPSWGAPSTYDGSTADANGGRMDRHTASQYYGSTQTQSVPPADDGWTRVGGAREGATAYRPPPVAPPVTTSPPPTQPPTMPAPLRGYDLDDNIAAPAPTVPPSNLAQTMPAPMSSGSPLSAPVPSAPTAGADTPRPPTTQTGSPLNMTKFGLLPKRPVSLLTPQSSATGTGARRVEDDEDDDELDYVENPFEQPKNVK